MRLSLLLLLTACATRPAVVISFDRLPKTFYTKDDAPACLYKVRWLTYHRNTVVSLELDRCGYIVGDTIEVK